MHERRRVLPFLALLVWLPGAGGVRAESSLAVAEVAEAYGIRAFLHGDFATAADHFREAVEADPKRAAARYWLGLAYLELGEGGHALQALEAALAARPPPAVDRERAAADLDRARELIAGRSVGRLVAPDGLGGELVSFRDQPRSEWRAGIALASDSNPLQIPEEALGLPPAGGIATEESDTALLVNLRGELHPFYDWRGFSLGLGLQLDQTLYRDLDTADLGQLEGTVHLAWGADPLGYLTGPLGFTRVPVGDGRLALLLQASFRHTLLDGDSFDSRTSLGLALTIRETRRTATQIDLTFTDRTAFAEGEGLEPDGEISSLRIGQYLYFGRRDRHLRLLAAYGERDAGAAFDASYFEPGLELAWPFRQRWALQAAASRRRTDFDELASNPLFPLFLADAARQDTLWRATAALIWAPRSHLRLIGRATFIDRQVEAGSATDLLALDIERTGISLGATWLF